MLFILHGRVQRVVSGPRPDDSPVCGPAAAVAPHYKVGRSPSASACKLEIKPQLKRAPSVFIRTSFHWPTPLCPALLLAVEQRQA